MKRETALLGALGAVVVASALVLVLVPGAVGDPGQETPTREGRLQVVEMPIEIGSVSKQTATLTATVTLQHRGPPMENVSVLVRAVDEDRDVVATATRVDLGTIGEQREVRAVANLTVERQGAYRFEAITYADGRRVPGGDGGRLVEGIGSLDPTYTRSPIEFYRADHRDGGLPTIGYSIASADEDAITLALSTRLTNGGTAPGGDLSLVLAARQADSNVIADRTTVHVGQIRPGRTVPTEATLTVPDEYNYHLVGVLKRDGVVVDTARSAANLDPEKTVVVVNETTVEDDEFSAADFAPSNEASTPQPKPTTEVGDGGSGPGFGAGVALVALLAVATLAVGRNRH
jgi:PGF-CTERM protein